MTDNVVPFPGITFAEIPPDTVLEDAKEILSEVLVLGFAKDTGDFFLASSGSYLPDINWLIDQAKKEVMRYEDE